MVEDPKISCERGRLLLAGSALRVGYSRVESGVALVVFRRAF